MRLPLYFLGDRPYVNGLTLLEESLIGACALRGCGLDAIESVLSFRVNRFVRTHCRLIDLERDAAQRRPAATLKLALHSGAHVALALQEDESAPAPPRRPDYDRKALLRRIEHGADGGTNVELAPPEGPFDLLRGLVEANHQFCTADAQRNRGGKSSWASLTAFPWPGPWRQHGGLEARFTLESVVRTPQRLFLIRSLHAAGQTTGQDAEFCFFYDTPATAGRQRS